MQFQGVVSDMDIYAQPWVAGTRASGYYGPVQAEAFAEVGSEEEIDKTVQEVLRALCDRAKEASNGAANAVVGTELSIEVRDDKHYRIHCVATVARLEPL